MCMKLNDNLIIYQRKGLTDLTGISYLLKAFLLFNAGIVSLHNLNEPPLFANTVKYYQFKLYPNYYQ